MGPENETICRRIEAEFSRTNTELNQLYADQTAIKARLAQVERNISDLEAELGTIQRDRLRCAVGMRLGGGPVGKILNGLRVGECAEKLRRAENRLRKVQPALTRARQERQSLTSDLNRIERRLHNTNEIRRTLRQQKDRHECH